ncbi:MAG TPA: MoxR family ATPase [Planctomycetota bacterium]|nr:MoxR family ATPase [Planctomycetota bacterium]
MAKEAAATADVTAIERCKEAHGRILAEVGKVIIGQRDVIDDVLMALFCDSHILLVGVPGLAKTLLISTLAKVLKLDFKRVQFTPDLLPGDITGSVVVEEDTATGKRAFRFVAGPVFTNLILADEINRTPPKTQSALLQAMQEREVTAGRETMKLERPFLVMATQNPLEQEGTYPLPEAQLDRFMFNTFVDYPTNEELAEIVVSTTGDTTPQVGAVMDKNEIINIQQIVRRVPVAQPVVQYIVRLSAATRPTEPSAPKFIKDYLNWGAGPRAAQYLALGAKARAVLHGNTHASIEDVRAVATSVLRHRVALNFNAQAEGLNNVRIIKMLLDAVPPNA